MVYSSLTVTAVKSCINQDRTSHCSGKVTETQEELNAERTKTETLQKENGHLKTENDQLKKEKEDLQTQIAECQGKIV